MDAPTGAGHTAGVKPVHPPPPPPLSQRIRVFHSSGSLVDAVEDKPDREKEDATDPAERDEHHRIFDLLGGRSVVQFALCAQDFTRYDRIYQQQKGTQQYR